jgi:electron transport complex protein RnfG
MVPAMTDRNTAKAALVLVAIGIIAAALLSWVSARTAATISANERNYQLQILNEIVPPSAYDNDLFSDTLVIHEAGLLGSNKPLRAYRARRNGEPVAVILNVVAPKGYSGAIHLLVGINNDGTLARVRVSQHRETPGLGDQIEVTKSDWILQFDQRSLADPSADAWSLKKDGGRFDQLTGATITPRAIVQAVRDALLYFEANRDSLFAAESEGSH